MVKIKISKYRILINNLVLILGGFIVFSPIASYISQNILNLPLTLPELLFIPFYFKFRKLFNLRINLKIFIIGFFIILYNTPQKLDRGIRWMLTCHSNKEIEYGKEYSEES
jgi:hypothetical protein